MIEKQSDKVENLEENVSEEVNNNEVSSVMKIKSAKINSHLR